MGASPLVTLYSEIKHMNQMGDPIAGDPLGGEADGGLGGDPMSRLVLREGFQAMWSTVSRPPPSH